MSTALLVIDVQMGFVTRRDRGMVWGNPDADTSIATVLKAFRDKGLPVLHVHHNALINFRQRLRDGREMAAVDVLALTLANLDGEFAHIASVNEILTQVAS